jgi:membrane protein implicated in regulation of membrane protease activity
MRRVLREQSLSLVFLALFLASLVGQAIAGWHDYNNLETWHAQMAGETPETLSLGRYITSSSFAQAVTENWQSEYLQFTLFILFTVWFIQKGSPESKQPGEEGLESEEQQLLGRHAKQNSPKWAKAGGWRTFVYSNSLLLVMATIWIWSWFAQSVSGWSENNAERLEHEQESLSWLGYLGSADFWQTTLQNWQSEFLAVGSMAVLAVYLRQRGSPESKPVGTPHDTTAATG